MNRITVNRYSKAVLALILFLGLAVVGYSSGSDCYSIDVQTVTGSSMEPVLPPGEKVVVLENYYSCHPVSSGDIATYQIAGNQSIVKYVKAVPGDNLSFRGCHLYRNGKQLKNSQGEPYCLDEHGKTMIRLSEMDNITGYLLLGNKKKGTGDSTMFGLYTKKGFNGKVLMFS